MAFDLIVRNGLIVDGSDSSSYHGDVAITNGRIVAVGRVDGAARRTIDAAGLVVSPGFVDVHTHYDAQLAWDPSATPSCAHGVTSVVIGNCGFTLAPVRPGDRDYLVGMFSRVEQIPKSTLLAGLPFEWESHGDYLAWLKRRGLGVNVVPQIGHSAVRAYVMGEAAMERAATADEVAAMAVIVTESLQDGAVGFTTSQAPHHVDEQGRHIPSYFADDEEVEALASIVRKLGHGMVNLNPNSKSTGFTQRDKDFMLKLSQVSGGALTFNDFGPKRDKPTEWREMLDYMEGAISRGNPIYAIARCQPTDLRFNLRLPGVRLSTLDGWADFYHMEGDEAKLKAIQEPVFRQRLDRSLTAGGYQADRMMIVDTSSPETASYMGRYLTEIGAERGIGPVEALLDIAVLDRLDTQFAFMGISGANEPALEEFLKSPATIVGISDGGAHLQTFATCEYTTYFLQHWVRETGAFSLEEGVKELTSRPARLFGITDRGLLAPGQAADIAIFDQASVGPGPMEMAEDLPGGGARIVKRAEGMKWVLVNGVSLVEDGAVSGALAGQIVGGREGQ
jgi:N-acyl-D-amino-acid deacylase